MILKKYLNNYMFARKVHKSILLEFRKISNGKKVYRHLKQEEEERYQKRLDTMINAFLNDIRRWILG